MYSNDNGLNLGGGRPICRSFVCVRKDLRSMKAIFAKAVRRRRLSLLPFQRAGRKMRLKRINPEIFWEDVDVYICMYVEMYVEVYVGCAYSIYVYALAIKVRISSPYYICTRPHYHVYVQSRVHMYATL